MDDVGANFARQEPMRAIVTYGERRDLSKYNNSIFHSVSLFRSQSKNTVDGSFVERAAVKLPRLREVIGPPKIYLRKAEP
jgi:hypothetical protein